MILTEEFLKLQNACAEGIQIAFDNKYLGQEYSDVIRNLVSIGQRDFAGWLIDQKNTEAYVRANGKVITMGTTYQVFNPMIGTHTEYETEAEAKTAIVEISKQILQLHKPTVCASLSNENGDSTWISVDLLQNVQVIIE
jgi:hypothetical protein